jgi:hypothetical protein
MCTLTFLPISEHSFLLGANRDESPHRSPAQPPVKKDINGQTVLYPVDGQAAGTWIAASDHKRIACVLNGAFAPHPYNPPYRLSRGLMVLASFKWPTTKAFIDHFSFEGFEPFTYVSFEWGKRQADKTSVTEVRWDGEQKHVKTLNGKEPHIWSSASLYTKEAIAKRKRWFEEWLQKHNKYRVEDILQFHHFGGEGDEANDIRMNRNNIVRTLSVTSVYVAIDKLRMYYEDLLTESTSEFSLPLITKQTSI